MKLSKHPCYTDYLKGQVGGVREIPNKPEWSYVPLPLVQPNENIYIHEKAIAKFNNLGWPFKSPFV